ncbi:MAG: hypothetical protein CMJ42_13450 [Phyllobacteriaceae bacterium]|nr:hypothetical protein [Phyllobacteriaceae bacterium]
MMDYAEFTTGRTVFLGDGRQAIIDQIKTRDRCILRFEDGTRATDHRLRLYPTRPNVPVDLWAEFNPPPLPANVLPHVIEAFAHERAKKMGVDPAGVAMAALTVAGAAIADRIRLRVKAHDDWHESARIWCALVAPPSGKKTPIISAAVRPLARIDATLAREFQNAMAEYLKLGKDEQKATDKPAQVRRRIEDTTIEAAQEILKDSPDGVLLVQDELSGWFGSMDKYSSGRGAAKDRAFWLQAFNGGTYAVNRIGRGSVFIENLSVSLLGGIQPEPLRAIVDGSHDDGLIQRLLPVILSPATVGEDAPSGRQVEAYEAAIERLYKMAPPKTGSGAFADLLPTELLFDDDARGIRAGMERRFNELQAIESIAPKLAAHLGKMDGIFARLCIVLHCLDHVNSESLPAVVTGDTAGRVRDFIERFILPHSFAFYLGTLGMGRGGDVMRASAGFLLAHPELSEVTARTIQRGDRAMRALDTDAAVRVLERLEACGWLDRIDPARNQTAPRWRVNHKIHTLYAERAKSEAQRRMAAQRAIAEAIGGGENG